MYIGHEWFKSQLFNYGYPSIQDNLKFSNEKYFIMKDVLFIEMKWLACRSRPFDCYKVLVLVSRWRHLCVLHNKEKTKKKTILVIKTFKVTPPTPSFSPSIEIEWSISKFYQQTFLSLDLPIDLRALLRNSVDPKSKIAKLCHIKGLLKPFVQRYVSVILDNYFSFTFIFSFRRPMSE